MRNEGHTCETIVVAVCDLVVDEDWVRTILIVETLRHVLNLILGDLEARPSVPLEIGGLAEATEASDKTARGHGEAVFAIFGALDGDGKTVGEQQEAPGGVDGVGHFGLQRRSMGESRGRLGRGLKSKWEIQCAADDDTVVSCVGALYYSESDGCVEKIPFSRVELLIAS